MAEYTEFIRAELLALIPVAWIIGAAIKHASAINDRYIPILLGGICVVLAALYVLGNSPLDTYQDVLISIFVSFVQGVLCAGAAVYGNQLLRQHGKK